MPDKYCIHDELPVLSVNIIHIYAELKCGQLAQVELTFITDPNAE